MRRADRIGVGLLALALFASGCYGPFNLTRRLYRWNGEVSDEKWGKEFVFLLLALTPVYGFATLADGVVFNSLEFWTGSNPVDPPGKSRSDLPQTRRIARGEDEVLLTRTDGTDGRAMTVALFKKGESAGMMRFEHRPGEPTVAKDAQGGIIMSAKTLADGGVVVNDGSGRQVALYTPDEVQQVLESRR